MRELFFKALSVVQDASLIGRLRGAVDAEEKDYRISVLDKANCALQELLIELHSHIETLEGDPARRMEKAIWSVLEHCTSRREFMTSELLTQLLLTAALQKEGQ